MRNEDFSYSCNALWRILGETSMGFSPRAGCIGAWQGIGYTKGMLSIIILAIIQALTEFIPVSSSGHLIAAEELTALTSSLSLDVALHFGTLLALLVYFSSRIANILHDLKGNTHLIVNLVLTSIPAAFLGFFLEDIFRTDTRSLGIVIVMMATVGAIMLFSETAFKVNPKIKKIEQIPHLQAYFIGLGQALALIPGTSRSGITMLAGKQAGLSNKLAAEYAFLAGIPVIAGASLKVFIDPDTNAVLRDDLFNVVVGVLVAAVVGFFALKFLIQYLSEKGLRVFGWYRLALAAVLFIIWINQ